jgi:hypothetical protein
MLEITGDDIALLNDEDLRTLVGRMCESEMRPSGAVRPVIKELVSRSGAYILVRCVSTCLRHPEA